MNNEMSIFAKTIMEQKYSHIKIDGSLETWPEIAYRVTKNVLKAIKAPKSEVDATVKLISERKFIPGGRYLYAAGRPFHQVQNCLLMRAEDSREGWADHLHKCAMSLMTGAGIGIDYSDVRHRNSIIKRTGGLSTGPIALMLMTNECGRGIMQGGSRRAAIWAGLKWWHKDVFEFIHLKDWSPEIRALKEKDFNFPAPMDMTNISVLLDDEFFKAYYNKDYIYPVDPKNPDKYAHVTHEWAQKVYWETIQHMLETAEPGFSVDCGVNAGETLRNAPVTSDTLVLTEYGYQPVSRLLLHPASLWTGLQWSPAVFFKRTKKDAQIVKVNMTGGRVIRCDEEHPFIVDRFYGRGERRILIKSERIAASKLKVGDVIHVSLPESTASYKLDKDEYTLGYIYGDGTFTQTGGAEVTYCTEASKKCIEPSREHWLLSSVNEEDNRGYKRAYFSVDVYWQGRDKAVFPVEVYAWGCNKAASFLAGLFDSDGNWEPTQKRLRLASKHEGFLQGVARLLEQYGILSHVGKSGTSTYGQAQGYQLVVASEYTERCAKFMPTLRLQPDLEGYKSYRPSLVKVLSIELDGFEDVYCTDVEVAEHTFQAEGVILSNCTEVTSRDDSDICNLGSINMAQINSLEEMEEAVRLGTQFLLAGTVYSDVPYEKVEETRTKNRRLGLGLMGIHEWLLKKGKKYDPDVELEEYLKIYATSTNVAAKAADALGISRPIKTRAIAPTGTIGIIAETTTGLEPLFCVAYKRRYLKAQTWHFQYVLDPTAKRLIESGVNPELIEDAYTLAEDPERRVAFQAWLQKYVDHSISSTLNLPAWGTELNNESKVLDFGNMLIRYLPDLRGFTCYPDGARSGQPINVVSYKTAMKHVDEIFIEQADICEIGHGGTCGS